MLILTVENEPYQLNNIPEEVEDIRYCVMDYSDPTFVDYIFVPLIFLESFNAPAAVLSIAGRQFTMPIDWSLVIGDIEAGDPEVISILHINDRGFNAFCYNPLSDYQIAFKQVDIVNIYSEVKWVFPKLKYGHLLAVPTGPKKKDPVVYFVKETNKIPDVLDLSQIW
tara:strand:+ start:248 stop:748 length:501 start_codon:yes stop_codon:yes gene_type:complete